MAFSGRGLLAAPVALRASASLGPPAECRLRDLVFPPFGLTPLSCDAPMTFTWRHLWPLAVGSYLVSRLREPRDTRRRRDDHPRFWSQLRSS